MIIDIPEFKRCCFCIPLRGGLLTWGYMKMILTVLGLMFLFTNVIDIDSIYIPAIFTFVDLGFTLSFIIGAHQENHKVLKCYYKYSIVLIVLAMLSFILTTSFIIYMMVCYVSDYPVIFLSLPGIIIGFLLSIISLFIQFYIILLIRSEINICKNKEQSKFLTTNTRTNVNYDKFEDDESFRYNQGV